MFLFPLIRKSDSFVKNEYDVYNYQKLASLPLRNVNNVECGIKIVLTWTGFQRALVVIFEPPRY